MTFLVIANFKSNFTQKEVLSWVKVVKPTPNLVIAPSSPHLTSIWSLDSHFLLAGQDVSPFPMGSYTGAVNAKQLASLGVKYCIVGHSERRRYFHETSVDVAAKVRELIASGITPIVCLEESDIVPQFAALDGEYLSKCIYCFEPSSDIGGTTTASPESILEFKHKLAQYVPDLKFMYGGSVNADNIGALLPLGLTGVLVSSACLEPASLNSLLAKLS